MEALARRVVEGIGAALLVIEGPGAVSWANPKAEELLGPGLAGRRLDRLEELEDQSDLLNELSMRLAQAEDSAQSGSLLIGSQPQGARYYWMSVSRLDTTGSGAPADAGRRVVALSDITEALTESPFLQRVFSQVSHDLRSPLTSISGACELLGSGRVGAIEGTQRKLVGIIGDGTRRMGEILEEAKGRFVRHEQAAGGRLHE